MTDTETTAAQDAQRKRAQQFIEALPHCGFLNMDIRETGPGRAVMSVPYDPRFIGDPATGVVHGGVITALLDSCAGGAVLMHGAGQSGTATLGLRIDYMRPAIPGKRIFAEAKVYHATRSVAFLRATAYEDDPADPIATGAGTFTVGGRKPGKEQS